MPRKVRGGAGRVPGSGGGRSVNIYVYMLRNTVAAPGADTGDRSRRQGAAPPYSLDCLHCCSPAPGFD